MNFDSFVCPCCGRVHSAGIKKCFTGSGAIKELLPIVKEYGKPYIMADVNTFEAAGKKVVSLLKEANEDYTLYASPSETLLPNEATLGSFLQRFTPDCKCVVAIGSGVINDTGKILSYATGRPYVIIGTAPSMDGYSSGSSSYEQDGIKKTLYNRCPDVVIGDTDILKNAPMRMIVSGLGDMLAKYVSICEWRLSNIITGEYYCETVAEAVRASLKKCIDNADGILKRDSKAVEAVFEGLVLSGVAMNYAGVSRPASGVEHYFSHTWDMRGLAFGTPVDFHGIQCAVGTLLAARIYDFVRDTALDKQKAIDFCKSFDREGWNRKLIGLLGESAHELINQATADKRYDAGEHAKRLAVIEKHWGEIQQIISDEMPTADEIEGLLDKIGCPKTPEDLGHSENIGDILRATKDIRDKYMAARFLFDIGRLDEIAQQL